MAHSSSKTSQRLAIYGIGGCGKVCYQRQIKTKTNTDLIAPLLQTALALESVYRLKELAPTCAVFWVSAASRESFDQGYRNIAMLLDISKNTLDEKDDAVNVRHKVKARLSDESYGAWLLIIDNADDTETLFSHADGLIDSLPLSRKGYIMFTTRTREIAFRLAERNLISLSELDGPESSELLRRRLLPKHQCREQGAFNTLSAVLTNLPLLIIQAAAYINTNDITLAEYMMLIKNNKFDTIGLESEDLESPGGPQELTRAVVRAWSVSFEQIKRQSPLAVDILAFMACIANNEIPVSIIPVANTIQQKEAISTLKAYHFVTERRTHNLLHAQEPQYIQTYDVHPLVHLAMRNWLETHGELDKSTDRAILRLAECIPESDTEARDVWRTVLPHAIHVATLTMTSTSEETILLLFRIACCERTLGRYEAAERSCRQAIEQRRLLSGRDYTDGKLVNQLIHVLYDLKRFEEAEALLDHLILTETKRHLEGRRDDELLETLERSMTKVRNFLLDLGSFSLLKSWHLQHE